MLRNSLTTNRADSNGPQQTGAPKPGDYELGSLESRAAARALLDRTLADQQKRSRLVVCGYISSIGTGLELDNTTCSCRPWSDGAVYEGVYFDGDPKSMTTAQHEQLEHLIRRVPIDGNTYRLVCSKNLIEIADRKWLDLHKTENRVLT